MNLDRRFLAGAVAILVVALVNLLPFMPGSTPGRLNGSVLLLVVAVWLAYKSGIPPLRSATSRSAAWLAQLNPAMARALDLACISAVILGVLLNASFAAGSYRVRAPAAVHPLATLLFTGGLVLLVCRRLVVRKRPSTDEALVR